MRLWIAIAIGAVIGIALVWWGREPAPAQREAREREAAAYAEAAMQPLYRWRDDAGTLQITEQPPKGRPYERIARDPVEVIQIRGNASPQPR
ncbi:MAG: DUF4124 domain-containing protein [Xanthomonadaceae bacterium]|jgi:hypothetical protein|nr:DUF4124 domain-containing protein [Xanthomonadaceae bacterium]